MRVTHPRLLAAFRRGVRFAEAERTFVVQVGPFRGWLDVEDTAFFVDAYEEATGDLALSDESREPLDPTTLASDVDGVLRCTVKSRFPARFTRAAQADLMNALELDGDSILVRLGSRRVAAPRLRP